MGDFTLSEETQRESFPAQMARQMQARLTQPLLQAPGIGSPVGFAQLPVVVPTPMQTTVLSQFPPEPVDNLSVPGYGLRDALNLRPSQPLIRRDDAVRTAANLILGVLPIAYGELDAPLPTQLECALRREPTFVIVELGYGEALAAAAGADPDLLPEPDSFRSDYAKLLKPLREAGAEVLALTVPDPFDTAHFSNVNRAAKILKVEPAFILDAYGVGADDLITPNGLNEIGFQIFSRAVGPLPRGCVVVGEVAGRTSTTCTRSSGGSGAKESSPVRGV